MPSLTDRLGVSYHQVPLLRADAEKLEADDSVCLTDGEHALSKAKYTRVSATFERIVRYGWLFLVLTGYVLLVANLIVQVRVLRHQASKETPPTAVYQEYGNDLRYQSLDPDYDFLWDGDLGATHGTIYQPSEEGKLELASISMFHQLHCLAYLRKTLQSAHAGKDVGLDWNDDRHWPHCFLYLRQAILCSADDSLEYPQVINGVRKHTISGMHDVRKCRDSQQVYDFRDKWSVKNFNVTRGH